ncbi:hypothetical protein P256_00515 [Acinetobacter nectaris CIP 110549]|uniref:Fluoroacetyl-CoA-specific thioesterase-like domain-containing protein n=1 Tax=Acinetobacter nectaris CIP 110549 TaxID=1392540 RepID=V2TPW7_9GAMM|nr:thioesterase family protein [Acinetobacter nectaris]ESK40076.1 hypothetical protein P256_00515 [Acinetobacter nectaris CIP 110549]
MKELTIGLKYTKEIFVDKSLTVPNVSELFTGFSDMPPVLATAYLIGFVEWTCIEALHDYLMPSDKTVGTHVNLSHSAATPIGLRIKAEVILININKKKLTFSVYCTDGLDIICEGTHERYIINEDKFLQKVKDKSLSAIKNISII